MSVLKNVKVEWASIQECDRKFQPVYRVDCIVSDEQMDEIQEAAKKLSSKGIKFRKNDNGDNVFRVKRNEMRADGSLNKKPVCKGTVKSELTGQLEDITALVGNGSLCNVQYNLYAWENSFGSGVNADFNGMQVLDLVSYGAADGDEFGEEEGSTSSSKPSSPDFDDDDFS